MDLCAKAIFEKFSDKLTTNLNTWIIYGQNERKFFDRNIIFTNISKGIIKRIIVNRNFCNFPGIEDEDEVSRYIGEGSLKPYIRYRSIFEKMPDDKIMMIWQVQPDGRFWEDDDGFGGSNDPEVHLYSCLDSNGKFTSPFKIYSIGAEQYYKGS